jgi:uncharacterized protein (TIGR02246 family)
MKERSNSTSGRAALEAVMTTENVMSNLADHVAIRHVVDQYTDALNGGDWATLESVFTKDAIWLVTTNDKVDHQRQGRQEIATGIRSLMETSGGEVFQMNHAPAIHVNGERATARSTMEASYFMPDGSRRMLFALYYDELVREQDGEWRFERREFRTKATAEVVPG